MLSKSKFPWQTIPALLLLSACNPMDWARQQWAALQQGEGSKPAPASSASPAAEALSTAAAQRAKAHGELLGEMLHVVLLRPPQDRARFGTLVDSLNQGASLEGIYNGLTHSSEYRKLEVANPGSSERARQVFAEALSELTMALPAPTDFTTEAAKPLAAPVQPGLPSGVEVMDFKPAKASPAPINRDVLVATYKQKFNEASIFTLKRILGDEALKVLEHFRADRSALSAWYSKWVVGMRRYGVDFGLASRNVADEKLHAAWAAQADADRLIWEVLNRAHRVLNDAQQKP